VRVFWERGVKKHNREDLNLPESLLPYFSRYAWPGNIRELENVMERILVLSRGPEVRAADLPEVLRREKPALKSLQMELPPTPISLDAVEKELIMQALERFDGNQTKAAQFLDLTRKTLIYRMERHGLKKREDEG
jgi:two-component system NtrC family response regulator